METYTKKQTNKKVFIMISRGLAIPVQPSEAVNSEDFPAFQVVLVRRLTLAEFAFLFMLSNTYVLF